MIMKANKLFFLPLLISVLFGCQSESTNYVTLTVDSGIGTFNDESLYHHYNVPVGSTISSLILERPLAKNLKEDNILQTLNWTIDGQTISDDYVINKDTTITANYFASVKDMQLEGFNYFAEANASAIIHCIKNNKPIPTIITSTYAQMIGSVPNNPYEILGFNKGYSALAELVSKTGKGYNNAIIILDIGLYNWQNDQRSYLYFLGAYDVLKNMKTSYIINKPAGWGLDLCNNFMSFVNKVSPENASGLKNMMSAFSSLLCDLRDLERHITNTILLGFERYNPYVINAKNGIQAYNASKLITNFANDIKNDIGAYGEGNFDEIYELRVAQYDKYFEYFE